MIAENEHRESEEVEIKINLDDPNLPLKRLINEKKYNDDIWRKLAKKNDIMWELVSIVKTKSPGISYKVATAAAFGVLTSLMKRDTFIDIAQEDLRLNLWILVIGESGWIGKTTARNVLYDILMKLKGDQTEMIPADFTPEGLRDELSATPSAVAISDEMSGFFMKLKTKNFEHLPTFMSDIFDNKEEIAVSRAGKKRITLTKPFLRIWGATTPDDFVENLEDRLFKQGFISRWTFIYEDEIKDRDPLGFHATTLKEDISNAVKQLKLIKKSNLKYIPARSKPKMFEDFEKYCNERKRWYRNQDEKLAVPYYARLPQRALKIAGILQLSAAAILGSKADTLPLFESWIEIGIMYAKLFERDFLKIVYEYRTQAPSVKHQTEEKRYNKFKNVLKQNDSVLTKSELLRKVHLLPKAFNEVLNGLDDMDLVSRIVVNKSLLVDYKILENEKSRMAVRTRPPELIYLSEMMGNEIKHIDCAEGASKDEHAVRIWYDRLKDEQQYK
jgi:hypothetical protein